MWTDLELFGVAWAIFSAGACVGFVFLGLMRAN